MDVGGTTLVVTGEDGLELGGSVGVGRLVTTMEGGVEVSGIGRPDTIHLGQDTTVNTSGVAVYRGAVR